MNAQVIFFLPSFESGGVERNAVYIANGLIKNGYKISVVYCRCTDEWFSKLDKKVQKIKINRRIQIPFIHERLIDALNMVLFFNSAIKSIRTSEPIVMISFQSNIIAIMLARIYRIPIAVRISNHYVATRHEKSLLRKISEYGKRITYRLSDIVLANSSELAKDYEPLLKKEVEVIQNPVDFERIKQLMAVDVEEKFFNEKKLPIIISAGRLSVQKNFPLLLRAMTEVLKEVKCILVILGEGSERKKLEQLVCNLGIEGSVYIIGYRENIYRYISRSDVFVLSSHYEGMPNVLIEAVSCNIPVVATRCKTGPIEILCEGHGGKLVPVNDYMALSRAIVITLFDPKMAKMEMSIAKKNLYRYSYKRIIKKYINLVDKLLKVK